MTWWQDCHPKVQKLLDWILAFLERELILSLSSFSPVILAHLKDLNIHATVRDGSMMDRQPMNHLNMTKLDEKMYNSTIKKKMTRFKTFDCQNLLHFNTYCKNNKLFKYKIFETTIHFSIHSKKKKKIPCSL